MFMKIQSINTYSFGADKLNKNDSFPNSKKEESAIKKTTSQILKEMTPEERKKLEEETTQISKDALLAALTAYVLLNVK